MFNDNSYKFNTVIQNGLVHLGSDQLFNRGTVFQVEYLESLQSMDNNFVNGYGLNKQKGSIAQFQFKNMFILIGHCCLISNDKKQYVIIMDHKYPHLHVHMIKNLQVSDKCYQGHASMNEIKLRNNEIIELFNGNVYINPSNHFNKYIKLHLVEELHL